MENTCSFYNSVDSISHFLIYCSTDNLFCKSWDKWWEAGTGFNIREENQCHKSILFGFPVDNDDAINYCILYVKRYFRIHVPSQIHT